MRARLLLPALASLAACGGPAAEAGRPATPPSERALPQVDPAARETPQAHGLLPIEQVAVRVRRGVNGQAAILEFLSPGLPESEQVALRLAFEQGRLRLAREGTTGEESWTTTLLPRGR